MHANYLKLNVIASFAWVMLLFAALVAPKAVLAETPILQIETGGHLSLIRSLQVSVDEKWLISASDDKTIRVWNLETGRLQRVLRGEIGPNDHGKIYAVALSPDGTVLAAGGPMGPTGGKSHPIRLYDFASGEILGLLTGHKEPVLALAFSKDGKSLISGGMDDQAIIWDVAANAPVLRLEGHSGDINAVRFSPDGLRAVTGSDDTTVAMWRVRDGQTLAHMKRHRGIVYDAVFSPDGKFLASGSADGTVNLWDAGDGRHIRQLPAAKSAVMSLAFRADGNTLIAGTGAAPFEVPAWDLRTGTIRTAYGGHNNLVLPALVLSGAGQGITAGGNDNEIDIWDLKSGKRVRRLRGLGQAVFSVQFSGDGKQLLWGHNQQQREINNWGSPTLALRLPQANRPMGNPRTWQEGNNQVQGAVTAANGLTLRPAASAQSAYFDLVEVVQGSQVRSRLKRSELDGYAHNAFTFADNAQSIVTGGGSGWLRRYDTNGRLLGDYAGHTGDVWAVAATRDGTYLASGSDDQTVRLWNLKSQENVASLFHARDGQWVMWTPQGYFSASPDGDEFIGWHVNKGPDKAADFVTAAQLKRHFYRPDIVDQSIRLASARSAIAEARNTAFSFDDLARRSPPSFEIVEAETSVIDEAVKLSLVLNVAANGDASNRVEVLVNGRNSLGSLEGLPGPDGGKLSLEVDGTPGQNLVEVKIGNDVGGSNKRIAVRAPQIAPSRRDRLIILSIGVNDYQQLEQDLSFASADAGAVYKGLSEFAGRLHQRVVGKLLTDVKGSAPTAANIRQSLEVLHQAKAGDTVIVFLAGHGINQGEDYLFLPRDARLVDGVWDPETVIDWRKLQAALAASKGRRIMVIDTCHAGNAFNPRLVKDADDANITVLAATDADTLAQERSSLGHGVFTHALLRGLSGEADTGADGSVQVFELGTFVEKLVGTITKGKQQPVARIPVSGDFVFSRY